MSRPTLHELGDDLRRVSILRRVVSLTGPFFWFAAYFVFALRGWWVPAVLCLVALSFVTYGSISHDLVHRNLHLPKRLNNVLLVVIELVALRSGTAYRLAHLNHHQRYPAEDDIEGAAAKMSFVGSIREGVRFQLKLFVWAWRHHPNRRRQLALEGGLIASLCAVSLIALPWSLAPVMYALLMTMGAWLIPLITSYIPHDPTAGDELQQTRAFRGKVLAVVAVQHLYHLEHHLYPAVPHHNWGKLARRLEPYLRSNGVQFHRLWF